MYIFRFSHAPAKGKEPVAVFKGFGRIRWSCSSLRNFLRRKGVRNKRNALRPQVTTLVFKRSKLIFFTHVLEAGGATASVMMTTKNVNDGVNEEESFLSVGDVDENMILLLPLSSDVTNIPQADRRSDDAPFTHGSQKKRYTSSPIAGTTNGQSI